LASLTAKTSKQSPRWGWRARIIGAGALLLASVAGAQSIEEERQALASAKAQSEAAALRAQKLEAAAAAELTAAERAKSESAAVAARIQSAEANITAAEARIRLIERQRTEQRARLAAKQEPAVRLLAALQTMARRPPGLALIQPGSTRDLVHVRAVLASMMPIVNARTKGLRADVEAGRKLRADADRALVALKAGQQQLTEERGRLVKLAATRRLDAQRLTQGAITEQDRAIALGEKARDILELMAGVTAAAEVRSALETLPGPVLRPTRPGDARSVPAMGDTAANQRFSYRLPVTGTVVTGLGEVSDTGVRARGLTIAARNGALVVAPARGRIAFAGPFRGFGQIVIIDHGGGWTSLITSLAALDARVGENVAEGGPIGRAGNDRPTVTIELRQAGKPVDIPPLLAG
jgi:murein hydrolase activator